MITILIVAGVFALLAGGTELVEGDWIEGIVVGLGAAALGAVCGFFIALFIGLFAYHGTHWEVTQHTSLVALADGSDTHGSFFLGSGTIDSEPSFTWYQSDGKNSYVRKSIEASESAVHYLPKGVAPYYTVTNEKKDGSFVRKWGFDTTDPYGEKYDFYVPRGSIVQSYRLDNK